MSNPKTAPFRVIFLRADEIRPKAAAAAAKDVVERLVACMQSLSSAKPTDQLRTMTEEGRAVQLLALERSHDGYWSGSFSRVRLSEPAKTGDVKKHTVTTIPLPDSAGPAEETPFMINEKKTVVALGRTKNGVSRVEFARFLSRVAPSSPPMYLTPIVPAGAVARWNKIKVVKSVEFEVSSQLDRSDTKDSALGSILDAVDAVKAPHVFMRLDVSRAWRKKSLASAAKGFVNMLRGKQEANPDSVPYLRVSGRTEGDEPDAIDFLSEQLEETEELQCDLQKDISVQAKFAAMKRMYRRHLADFVGLNDSDEE